LKNSDEYFGRTWFQHFDRGAICKVSAVYHNATWQNKEIKIIIERDIIFVSYFMLLVITPIHEKEASISG